MRIFKKVQMFYLLEVLDNPFPCFKNDFSSLPLIGVSLMKEKGQTFVFNESALERILIQNSKLFKRVEFFDSNFSEERKIAIFYK